MKKEKKVKNKKKSLIERKELLIGIVFLIAAIIGIAFLLLNTNDNDNNDNKNDVNNNTAVDSENNVIENNISSNITEKDIIDSYGVSMEDAKLIVKSNFNSDNFEYTVKISKDATYIVTAKNIIDDTKYVFEVNPTDKKSVEILSSE